MARHSVTVSRTDQTEKRRAASGVPKLRFFFFLRPRGKYPDRFCEQRKQFRAYVAVGDVKRSSRVNISRNGSSRWSRAFVRLRFGARESLRVAGAKIVDRSAKKRRLSYRARDYSGVPKCERSRVRRRVRFLRNRVSRGVDRRECRTKRLAYRRAEFAFSASDPPNR